MFKNFPSGSVIAIKIKPKEETVNACKSIDEIVADDRLKQNIQNSIRSLDAQIFNYLLFRCEKEEQVEYGQDAYDVPNFGKFVYCGLKGIEIVIRKIQETNDLGHPLCGNLREGTWLVSYIVNRLRRIDELKTLADLIEKSLKPLDYMPHFLRPCYFELAFSYIFNAIEEVLVEKLGYVKF
jgi:glycogen debranching enzyme